MVVAVPPFRIARVPLNDPRVRQLPETAKQPAVRLTPVAKVDVAPVSVLVPDPLDIERREVEALVRLASPVTPSVPPIVSLPDTAEELAESAVMRVEPRTSD